MRLSGRSLADQIACGPLAQPLVRSILDDVLSALAAAHAAGILHRDIKPANILLTDLGHTKVANFGIAKCAETTHTMTGQIVGTMAYLTPERIAGRRATVSDDLYALGVVGYEALTGRRPFPQQNLAELAPGRLPSNRRLHSPCCGRTWIRVWRKRSNGPWRVTRSADSAAPPLCAPRSPAN